MGHTPEIFPGSDMDTSLHADYDSDFNDEGSKLHWPNMSSKMHSVVQMLAAVAQPAGSQSSPGPLLPVPAHAA